MIFRKRKNTLEARERRAHLIGEAVELYKKNTILIHLDSPAEFYNSFDPESEDERELSDEVEAYILKEMEHKNKEAHIGITILTDDASQYDRVIMQKAFANHFKIRAEEQIIKNRVSLYNWIRKLILGILVLGFFLLLARLFRVDPDVHPFLNILSEGFGIVGWVALWEPATYFLYGHNEGRELLMNYMKLHRATVTIQNISD
ncbi:MAG: hypothetical protein II684_00525 [Treponema sp.]|nr:hypothetical protein [Treponema sp.]